MADTDIIARIENALNSNTPESTSSLIADLKILPAQSLLPPLPEKKGFWATTVVGDLTLGIVDEIRKYRVNRMQIRLWDKAIREAFRRINTPGATPQQITDFTALIDGLNIPRDPYPGFHEKTAMNFLVDALLAKLTLGVDISVPVIAALVFKLVNHNHSFNTKKAEVALGAVMFALEMLPDIVKEGRRDKFHLLEELWDNGILWNFNYAEHRAGSLVHHTWQVARVAEAEKQPVMAGIMALRLLRQGDRFVDDGGKSEAALILCRAVEALREDPYRLSLLLDRIKRFLLASDGRALFQNPHLARTLLENYNFPLQSYPQDKFDTAVFIPTNRQTSLEMALQFAPGGDSALREVIAGTHKLADHIRSHQGWRSQVEILSLAINRFDEESGMFFLDETSPVSTTARLWKEGVVAWAGQEPDRARDDLPARTALRYVVRLLDRDQYEDDRFNDLPPLSAGRSQALLHTAWDGYRDVMRLIVDRAFDEKQEPSAAGEYQRLLRNSIIPTLDAVLKVFSQGTNAMTIYPDVVEFGIELAEKLREKKPRTAVNLAAHMTRHVTPGSPQEHHLTRIWKETTSAVFEKYPDHKYLTLKEAVETAARGSSIWTTARRLKAELERVYHAAEARKTRESRRLQTEARAQEKATTAATKQIRRARIETLRRALESSGRS